MPSTFRFFNNSGLAVKLDRPDTTSEPGTVDRSWTLLIAVSLVGSEAAAHADVSPDDARRASKLFEQGRKELAVKHLDAACEAFAGSLALDPQIGTRLNLAACRVQQGNPNEGYALFEAALAESESTGKQARATYARDQMRALEAKLVRVHFVLTNPAGATVSLDGVTIDPAKRQLVRPGQLTIDVTAPDRRPYHVEKIADAGADITIDVPTLEPSTTTTTTPTPVTTATGATTTPAITAVAGPKVERSHVRLPYVVGGIGGALLVTAGGLTLHARSRWNTAIDNLDTSAVTRAQHEADIATAFSIAGGVALGIGVVLWVRGRGTDRIVVTPSPSGLAVKGAF
jgi:hypothetical protein